MTTKNHYKAQALAIIMIILIISSMIGFAVFSRSQKAKRTAIQERNSAEAYQVADMILDNLLLSTLEDWLSKGMLGKIYTESQFVSGNDYRDPENPTTGQLIKNINAKEGDMEIQKGSDQGSRQITELIGSLGNPLNLQDLNICSLREHSQNEYRLSLTEITSQDIITIKPGQTFTFLREDRNFEGCNLQISVINPNNQQGLVVNKIYHDGNGIKDYDYSDTTSYKFSTSNTNFTGNWELKEGSSYSHIVLHHLNNTISAIGLTAVNEEVNFSFSFGAAFGSCSSNFDVYKLKASANCGGTYRAKEVIIPATRYTHSIFNYVFFNGLGNIGTN